jgi:hypothetical protein
LIRSWITARCNMYTYYYVEVRAGRCERDDLRDDVSRFLGIAQSDFCAAGCPRFRRSSRCELKFIWKLKMWTFDRMSSMDFWKAGTTRAHCAPSSVLPLPEPCETRLFGRATGLLLAKTTLGRIALLECCVVPGEEAGFGW